ncbi:MAG: hypothetical protein QW379_08000 [Thermoplasmata archaeon]
MGVEKERESGTLPGDRRYRFHLPMLLLWLFLGTLIAFTSVLALQLGVEALYLLVTGWIIAPFFLHWLYRKLKRRSGR